MKDAAALLFQALLFRNGAKLAPRDRRWLDYSERKNAFTRHYRKVENAQQVD